jgi:GxxExxY protein
MNEKINLFFVSLFQLYPINVLKWVNTFFSQSFAEMNENDLSYLIRGAAFKVHTALGPGLLESVYEVALSHELKTIGLEVKNQVGIPFVYAEIRFDIGFRLDIIVNDKVIIEIKSVETLQDVHHKQLLTYLKLTNKKLGLLINFNIASLKYGIIRIVNNL